MITELNKKPGALNGLEEPLEKNIGSIESNATVILRNFTLSQQRNIKRRQVA
jgi:hypothetical protein